MRINITTFFYIAGPCARHSSKYFTIINELNLHNDPTESGTINTPLITGEETERRQRHRAGKSLVNRGQESQETGALSKPVPPARVLGPPVYGETREAESGGS